MDLTPTAGPNPFGTAGGAGGGERLGLGGEALNDALGGALDGAEDGNVGGMMEDINGGSSGSRELLQELAVDEDEDKPEETALVFLKEPPGTTICGGVISSGQGVRRFCIQGVVNGTDGCGTGTHRTKADVAARAWHIKVRIRGNVWAGLVNKRLMREDILEEDINIFDQDSHAAGPWMTRFQIARLAKLGAVDSLQTQADAGIRPEVGLQECGKTPAKRRREGEVEFEESPSWVDVAAEGTGFEGIRSWGPLTSQEEINRLTQANFDLLRKETIRASGNWIDALMQLRESTKKLLSAQSQAKIRLGTPGAFGARVGVVNAFDGLRHLMELLEDAESKFDSMPYEELVSLTKKLDQSVVAMNASDPWATETSELRQKIDVNKSNLGLLRDRSVGPLVAMHNCHTDKGSSVPGNRLKDAIIKLQSEMVQIQQAVVTRGQTQGIGVIGGAQPGFGFQVPQGGGGSGLSALETRILAAEKKDADLENDLAMLKNAGGSTASNNPFGGPPAGGRRQRRRRRRWSSSWFRR
jgi:hypothetical protein